MFTLTKELTKQYKESFQSKPERIVAQNAAVKNGLKGASETVASVVESQPVYSIDLEHGKVANQKASGRCWMFAALNTFRHRLFNNFKLEEFELSQSYTFFWDKY